MARKQSRVSAAEALPALRYVEHLLAGNGDITLGRVEHHPCVATAADEDMQLAMLVRRKGESLVQLLVRLDRAIESAFERHHVINEVYGPD